MCDRGSTNSNNMGWGSKISNGMGGLESKICNNMGGGGPKIFNNVVGGGDPSKQ